LRQAAAAKKQENIPLQKNKENVLSIYRPGKNKNKTKNVRTYFIRPGIALAARAIS
jgi:hypothetical protein